MHVTLIVNPRSGGDRTRRIIGDLLGTIRHHFPDAQTQLTSAPGHAIQLARDAAHQGTDLVVSIGGDGTLNEVVNGLMLAKEQDNLSTLPQLGVLPQGTGGDFRRTFGVEHRFEAYLQKLKEDVSRPLDIGRATFLNHEGQTTTRYFANILSVGVAGLVDQYVADSSRAMGGSAAYFTSSLKAIQRCALAQLRCTIYERVSGQPEERVLHLRSRNLAICNGQFFGGGMKVAPMADPQDKTFDLINFNTTTKVQLTYLFRSIYEGTHTQLDTVQHTQAARLDIELLNDDVRDTFLLDVDGEALGTLPLRIELVPHALQLKL
ncbi:MAG: hypothetical protein CL920_09280 [Deltaproteobacteria bacterium]|nr:hypothetical protein [Deltaproteobacteria bacterium]MBU48876.1 hypothetical protein [Deltaproteobacteria bacterium]|tara:strand:+ start:32173 stop:33132 length:960 start_codon:yes stop_codon:yes gene_type:complete